ncbi:MAG: type II toxin-antitoxin system RelE/ParE family toxin [Gammaproteobacteria bacterium]|nr:type II toxin-antitoxin system RelE/ParE family toxin [Gammaproteobacteria bacterium]
MLGNWEIKFDSEALEDLLKLNPHVQNQILKYLKERLAIRHNPKTMGKPLVGTKSGLWRYRVGDYRIICEIKNKELLILVITVGHRREIYKH